jgi:hypothetical protein
MRPPRRRRDGSGRLPVEVTDTPLLVWAANRPPPELPGRCRFDWSHTTYAAALRQLCERYGLQAWPEQNGGYLLISYPGAPPWHPAPLEAAPRFTQFGTSVVCRSITMIEGRSNAPPSLPSITPQMQVELDCLPPAATAGVSLASRSCARKTTAATF